MNPYSLPLTFNCSNWIENLKSAASVFPLTEMEINVSGDFYRYLVLHGIFLKVSFSLSHGVISIFVFIEKLIF